ncbi:MAG: glycosyltransferase family 4 protein [Planctomycetota bacterium]
MTASSLRILHLLSHDRVKSGGAFQAILLARAQRSRGCEVRFVHNSGRNEAEATAAFEPLVREGFECDSIPMQHFARFGGRRRFRRLVAQFEPDVLHSHRERAMRFAVSALRDLRGPVLLAQKGNCYPSDRPTAAAYRSERLDRIIAVAEAVKSVLVFSDRVRPEKVEVIYGSFDGDRFGRPVDGGVVRSELGIPEAVPVIGIVANLDRKKGHALFFQMARKILEQKPGALFAVIGGGDLERARAQARQCGVLDSILFTGFRRDVERLLSALDVSVNCSHGGEGLTGAIRESMALGLPVVCTDIGGNSELVRAGETGHLVQAGDEKGMAEAVLHLLDNPEQATRMAAAGRDLVHRLMNNEGRCDQVMALYEELLKWRRR